MVLNELVQAGEFYRALPEKEKSELEEAIAEDIFFLEDELRESAMLLLSRIDGSLGTNVKKINDIT